MRTVLTTISKCVDTIRYFLESENSPDRDYPVVIDSYSPMPPKYIFYNSEQLTRPDKIAYCKIIAADPRCIEIWDYSAANVEILFQNEIAAKHVPLRSSASYLSRLSDYRNNSVICYDVGFCGWTASTHRRNILDQLFRHGIRVHCIELYGEERDRELAKCAIHINIHFDSTYRVFESNRCEPWLAIGVPVISEDSLDNDPRCINVPYNKLIETVLDYFSHSKGT